MAQYMLPGGPMIDTGDTARQYMLPGGPMIDVPSTAPPAVTAVPNSLMLMGAGT